MGLDFDQACSKCFRAYFLHLLFFFWGEIIIIIIIIIIIGNITVNESVTKKLQNSTVSSKASKFSTASGRLSKYKQSLD